eukprot:602709-Amphidinium_carterae.1
MWAVTVWQSIIRVAIFWLGRMVWLWPCTLCKRRLGQKRVAKWREQAKKAVAKHKYGVAESLYSK